MNLLPMSTGVRIAPVGTCGPITATAAVAGATTSSRGSVPSYTTPLFSSAPLGS